MKKLIFALTIEVPEENVMGLLANIPYLEASIGEHICGADILVVSDMDEFGATADLTGVVES